MVKIIIYIIIIERKQKINKKYIYNIFIILWYKMLIIITDSLIIVNHVKISIFFYYINLL